MPKPCTQAGIRKRLRQVHRCIVSDVNRRRGLHNAPAKLTQALQAPSRRAATDSNVGL